jgi:hypothetical protein
VAVRKDAQMAQLAGAFGLDGDFAEGEAFDPEAQVCACCAITRDPTAAMAAKAPTTGATSPCLTLPCFRTITFLAACSIALSLLRVLLCLRSLCARACMPCLH